ncbi:hypothetical protein [Nostoc sp. FACHB-190]|uniref:hypothetical protein n=1 Tax=Nostoc sp. FACHB-190 TaxID=2692838 RepID=UPI001682D9FB|nr:hypothetical protein [Nostoc sp. FACHB-190]MBD2303648.1 hypothetical protein [Nostoc sp. FACHB-190]
MTYFTNTEQASKGFNRNAIDELVVAQAELYNYIEAQAQAVAPEEFTSVEIDFYNHEIYANGQLIAQISYDHNDFVTQRWLVMVNNKEEFRADAWGRCYRYICTHHKDGSLPVQEEAGEQGAGRQGEEISPLHPAPCPVASCTGNEIMAQIFNECENLGLELLEDGIYRNDEKLGEVGCTNGNWWFTRASDAHQQRILCDSVSDAVWYVSRAELPECTALDEYLQYRPLEQMPSVELKELLDSAEFVAA